MGRTRRGSGGRLGVLPSQVLSLQLKHRILSALSKLGDRHTQHIAVNDLERIVANLSPDGISICLSCLYDTDDQQKSTVRKECIKLLGTLATVHADTVFPHLARIIANIVRRLKDPDTNVRDSCQETVGVLSAQYLCYSDDGQIGGHGGSVSGSILAVFLKPLFDALGEQNKSLQSGAALCLAKVVENARIPSIADFQQLCSRICKCLSSPNFLAKAALFSVIGSLVQNGAIALEHLPTLMPCIHDSLDSTDWGTRKAAAETLTLMAMHLSPILISSKPSTIAILEACRFDKVKPVRESVAEALQLWKNISSPEGYSKLTTPQNIFSDLADAETTEMAQELRKLDIGSSSLGTEANSFNHSYMPSDYLSNCRSGKTSAEKRASIVKNKSSALANKKMNPEFFQKMETRGLDDWTIEVAVPHGYPPSVQLQDEGNDKRFKERIYNNRMTSRMSNRSCQSPRAVTGDIENRDMIDSEIKAGGTYSRIEITDNFLQDQLNEGSVRNNNPESGFLEMDDWGDANQRLTSIAIQSRDAGASRTSLSGGGSYSDRQDTNGSDNWAVIQRQLSQLEHQQLKLIEMLQDFMGISQQSMLSMENRVQDIERVVENMAQNCAVSAGREGSSHMIRHNSSTGRSSRNYHWATGYSSPELGEEKDGWTAFPNGVSPSEVIPFISTEGRESLWRTADTDKDMEGSCANETPRNEHFLEEKMSSRSSVLATSMDNRSPRNDHDDEGQYANRMTWDRGSRSIRREAGPSGRSVWQASKDEATLAAIRVAGENEGPSDMESLQSRSPARVGFPELNEQLPHKSVGQGKGPFWMLWSHAMEFLHSGDIDSAYVKVLHTGDELLLVRLISRTGPVVDQLCTKTVRSVLQAIGKLLQQQSFFDFGIPWIQQVADMIGQNGAECLGLSLEAKKELLLCLHEAEGMDLPEGWEGSTVDLQGVHTKEIDAESRHCKIQRESFSQFHKWREELG